MKYLFNIFSMIGSPSFQKKKKKNLNYDAVRCGLIDICAFLQYFLNHNSFMFLFREYYNSK